MNSAKRVLLKAYCHLFKNDNTFTRVEVYTALGVLILWVGWFGFNAGSTLQATDGRIGHIAIVTMLSAASGGAGTMLYTLFRYGRSDAPSVINGSLAGLVGITAGCAFVSDIAAILIGAVSGMLMIAATQRCYD